MRVIHILALSAALLVGCGDKNKDTASSAGQAIGKQITGFTKGVAMGIDQEMSVQIALTPEVQALGLTNTIAKSFGLDQIQKGISVYFIASQSVSNKLIVRALNAEGLEIGRARRDVVLEKDDADYIEFEFDEQTDMALVKSFSVGL